MTILIGCDILCLDGGGNPHTRVATTLMGIRDSEKVRALLVKAITNRTLGRSAVSHNY